MASACNFRTATETGEEAPENKSRKNENWLHDRWIEHLWLRKSVRSTLVRLRWMFLATYGAICFRNGADV